MKRLLVSCFGLGRLPIAPGTWGSLPVAVVFGLMSYFGISGALMLIALTIMTLAGCVVCVKCSSERIAATGNSDPGEVVADEFAGQAVTFMPVAIAGVCNIWVAALAGFLLFRLFDIVKPWPIRKLEKFPAGWGILLDDLLAGVYAGVVLLIGLKIYNLC